VGLTEHMPAARDDLVPPEERAAGLDASATQRRFRRYFARARELQAEYEGRLRVLVGFESEAHSGYEDFVADFVAELGPDYIVGSVHHVHDVTIDASPDAYATCVERSGGHVGLYCDYFDLQYEMLERLRPSVVGHMDLIRLLDEHYPEHLANADVWSRIERNLDRIGEQGAILDVNVRALAKGQPEPYPSRPILEAARERGIRVATGDDSHGVASVGAHCEQGARLLAEMGFETDWPLPA
jgi:histidinol-phosphatase (PHP family)